MLQTHNDDHKSMSGQQFLEWWKNSPGQRQAKKNKTFSCQLPQTELFVSVGQKARLIAVPIWVVSLTEKET